MPSTGIPWVDWLLLVAAVLTVLGGGIKFVVDHVTPFFRALSNFLDDWSGEPARPGYSGRTGVMTRLSQLENNGGGSINDAVDRIEQTVDVNGRQLAEHIEQANRIIAQGDEDKRNILGEIARLGQANSDLAEAMPIVAASQPPHTEEKS